MLYFSVPVGKNEGIIYNAHRIFNPKTVVAVFDEMKLMEFSYIQNYHILQRGSNKKDYVR